MRDSDINNHNVHVLDAMQRGLLKQFGELRSQQILLEDEPSD